MVGGVLLIALVFEMLDAKSGDIKAWVKSRLEDTAFINKVNTVVENTITKLFSKADQYALLSGKVENVLESLKANLSEEAFQYLTNNLQKDQISDLMETVRKLEKELGSTEIKLSEAQVKKLLEGLKDGKGVDSVVAELKTLLENSKLKAIDTGELKVIEVRNPDIANREWFARGYDKPPYNSQYEVKIVEAGNEEYVRVFSYNLDGTSNKLGGWLMKKSDITGLSPAQIADKYALPTKPTHICDVKLKPKTKLQTGIANSVEEWGSGGGQQFDTLGNRLPVSSFVNEHLIGE